jgi:hypothetical protein
MTMCTSPPAIVPAMASHTPDSMPGASSAIDQDVPAVITLKVCGPVRRETQGEIAVVTHLSSVLLRSG